MLDKVIGAWNWLVWDSMEGQPGALFTFWGRAVVYFSAAVAAGIVALCVFVFFSGLL